MGGIETGDDERFVGEAGGKPSSGEIGVIGVSGVRGESGVDGRESLPLLMILSSTAIAR